MLTAVEGWHIHEHGKQAFRRQRRNQSTHTNTLLAPSFKFILGISLLEPMLAVIAGVRAISR